MNFEKMFYREEKENAILFWKESGEVVTKLDCNIYCVEGISARYEHPNGIIISINQAIELGIDEE
jgi:hypothetical protein